MQGSADGPAPRLVGELAVPTKVVASPAALCDLHRSVFHSNAAGAPRPLAFFRLDVGALRSLGVALALLVRGKVLVLVAVQQPGAATQRVHLEGHG